MKILSIAIVDNTVNVTVDSSTGVNKVYLDSIYNEDNWYSLDDDKHDRVVTPKISENTILIALDELSPALDTSAFIVAINGVVGFYFDSEELYYKEIELLTEYCSTCLDKHQKERIALFMLKQLLLEYAYINNLVEDQVSHYKDLARMLHIDVEMNMLHLCSGSCKSNRCRSCCNGVCSVC